MIKDELKKILNKRKMSAYKLSKLSGIRESNLDYILRGDTLNPRLDTLIKIADALDVTLDELVGRKRNRYD